MSCSGLAKASYIFSFIDTPPWLRDGRSFKNWQLYKAEGICMSRFNLAVEAVLKLACLGHWICAKHCLCWLLNLCQKSPVMAVEIAQDRQYWHSKLYQISALLTVEPLLNVICFGSQNCAQGHHHSPVLLEDTVSKVTCIGMTPHGKPRRTEVTQCRLNCTLCDGPLEVS